MTDALANSAMLLVFNIPFFAKNNLIIVKIIFCLKMLIRNLENG
jgi:hypothetical protein